MKKSKVLSLLAALLLPAIGWAADAVVAIRGGDHPGFGRIVLDLPAGAAPDVAIDGQRLTVRMRPSLQWSPPPRPPRNVTGIKIDGNAVHVEFSPKAVPRRTREQNKLILDFADPPAVPATEPADPRGRGTVKPPTPPPPVSLPPAKPTDAAEPKPDAMPKPEDVKARPDLPERPSLALIARPNGDAGNAILVPFGPDVGAAAFRSEGLIHVVFDEARPIDLAHLRDSPAFAKAEIRILPGGTVLTVPAEPGGGAVLSRGTAGWTVDIRPTRQADVGLLHAEQSGNDILIPTETAGRVVAFVDPESGAPALIGTVRQAPAAMPASRRSPEFRIPVTYLGFVVEPIADRVSMRVARKGFILTGGPAATLALPALDSGATPSVKALSRQFDFPALPLEALLRRLQAAQAATATAAPQQRSARRIEQAQALLSLGLGAEGQSLLALTTADDPRVAGRPDVQELQAIAAIIAGRFDEASRLVSDTREAGDETTLWRGLLAAMTDQPPVAAAPLLAATIPILLDYPPPLQRRFLPIAAEALARGGEAEAARKLVETMPDDRSLDFARALLARAPGGADGPATARQILERMSTSSDRRARSRALGELVELKLAAHAISASQAAEELDRTLYSWRGDDLERQRRLRIAALRGQAGQWKQAMSQLRDIAAFWPDQAGGVKPLLLDAFGKVFEASKNKTLPAFDFLTLAAENTDLLPDGEKGQDIARHLADQLELIELPRRAAEELGRLAAAAPAGAAKAELGLRLAAQRQQAGDDPGALDALNGSSGSDLPVDLQERRRLASARSMAALGDAAAALAALEGLTSTLAFEMRATLEEKAGNWRGATDILHRLAGRDLPREGPIDRAGALLVLRLASAAARAGDRQEVASIRSTLMPRIAEPEFRPMLEILTAERVEGVSDFERAAAEAKLALTISGAARSVIR